MTESSAVALMAGAVALLGRGGDDAELRRLVEVALPEAFGPRLSGRTVTGAVTDGVATVTIAGGNLGRCRVVVELHAEGAHVRLDLGGETLPEEFADVRLRLDYAAGDLPSDHRWWSDLGGLLMVGELSAAPG